MDATDTRTVVDDETRESDPADDDLTTGQIKLTDHNGGCRFTSEYRVDVSDDNGKTWSTTHESTLPVNTNEYEHVGLKPEEGLRFRLFGKKGSDIGLASNVVLDYAGNSDMPGKVGMLQAAADGAGKINVSWKAPLKDDGGADVEQYCIVVNEVDADENDAPMAGEDAMTRANIMTTGAERQLQPPGRARCHAHQGYRAEPYIPGRLGHHHGYLLRLGAGDPVAVPGLRPEQSVRHRRQQRRGTCRLQNGNWRQLSGKADLENDGRHAVSRESDKAKATTGEAVMPGVPQRLSAQSARDVSDISGDAGQGVVLLWNPPSDPAGAPVLSYKIELKVGDGEFDVEVETHPAATTHWVDTDELVDEMRTYRISATNVAGAGTANGHGHDPVPADAHDAHDAHDAARGGRADCAEHHRRDGWNRHDNGRVDAGRER